ncbi:hypothetical protein [Streptomyces sp. H27-C3]|uniref:hypothetical protein n=1 Tax=Streptomyces sp. H27-C3 TaxID=3046305 RepID=UPI0024BB5AEB|nr:hypothetical protein [Streptomyces sp. H27-C3]MDJ0466232.1 hypothetical protein [Streptomyces sp. H27-C3]
MPPSPEGQSPSPRATQRRLMREVPAPHRHMLATTALTVASAVVVIAQAGLLAAVLAGGFTGDASSPALYRLLLALGVVAVLRGGARLGADGAGRPRRRGQGGPARPAGGPHAAARAGTAGPLAARRFGFGAGSAAGFVLVMGVVLLFAPCQTNPA